MIKILQQVEQTGGKDYVAIVLEYLLSRGELSDKTAFFKLINTEISEKVGDKIMTGAEQLRQEGRFEGKLEGKREGKLEIATRMMRAGFDPKFVTEITGLSLDTIRTIEKQLFLPL